MSVDVYPLFASALTIFVVGYAILSRFLPKWAAIAIALVKAAVPLVYFGYYFDVAGWTLHDDVQYFRVGAHLVELGYRPWDFLFHGEARDLLSSMAASRHTLYYLWNVLAQYIIGTHYYAAVMLNVLVTFVAGALLVGILRLLDFAPKYQRGALAFHMLHWDYLTWTSMINVKESLVEVLILLAVYCLVRFVQRGNWTAILGLAISFLLLFSLRLYVPFLILTAAGVWTLLAWQDSRKFLLLPAVIVCLFLFYAVIGDHDHELYPHQLLVGAVRFMLTPQPWNIAPSYSFLQIPMWFQWLFLFPALLGGLIIWQKNPACRLPILVLLAFVAFYSIFPAHQGPRHRVQLAAFMALIQFQGMASLFGWSAGDVSTSPENHQDLLARPSLETARD
jgi:hypothetical protein